MEILGEGDWIRLYRDGKWEYASLIKGTGCVIIPATTIDRQYIFVEQFRVPQQRTCIEWAAGVVGDEGEETVINAAIRELLEETGYCPDKYHHLDQKFPASPGTSTEMLDVVLCWDCYKVEDGGGVDGENIIVHTVPFDEVNNWIQTKSADCYIDCKVFMGLYIHQEFFP
jgi:ADP-ribose pyrophosphatase